LGGPDTGRLTPVVVGPTAVGKTAVVAAWAALEPITVVSADARQVYRELDVGTAKPTPALLARVPHLGLDVVAPGERYSAGRFARDAARWLEEIRAAARQPVVVGGTGLYVRALADGLFREPPLDAVRRERLRTWRTGRHGSTGGSPAVGGSGRPAPSKSRCSRGAGCPGGRRTRARPEPCVRGTFS